MVFGRLTVLKRVPEEAGFSWLCKCTCGEKKRVRTGDLNSGNVSSCGCAREDNGREPTHGMSHLPEYHVWHDMIRRCTNPKCKNYKNYGARDITVCKRWLDFEKFYKDMGTRPAGHELDREDNDKGYSKSNCRWVTHQQNNNNKQGTRFVTIKDQTLSLADWARKLNVPYDKLGNAWRRKCVKRTISNLLKENS